MAAYLIFVEGVKRSDTEGLIKELGLEKIERGGSALMWSQVMEGPGGQAGLIGGWMQNSLQPAYKPNVQKWCKAPGGKFWVGTWDEWPVQPDDLLRNDTAGRAYPIKLEDGNDWMIPVARWLPHRWGMDDSGKCCRVPAPGYAEFCLEAEKLYQRFVEAAQIDGPMLIETEWDYVCDALAMNYRIAPAIVSVLGLVGDDSGPMILAATIEWSGIKDVDREKKNTESATTDGTPST